MKEFQTWNAFVSLRYQYPGVRCVLWEICYWSFTNIHTFMKMSRWSSLHGYIFCFKVQKLKLGQNHKFLVCKMVSEFKKITAELKRLFRAELVQISLSHIVQRKWFILNQSLKWNAVSEIEIIDFLGISFKLKGIFWPVTVIVGPVDRSKVKTGSHYPSLSVWPPLPYSLSITRTF